MQSLIDAHPFHSRTRSNHYRSCVLSVLEPRTHLTLENNTRAMFSSDTHHSAAESVLGDLFGRRRSSAITLCAEETCLLNVSGTSVLGSNMDTIYCNNTEPDTLPPISCVATPTRSPVSGRRQLTRPSRSSPSASSSSCQLDLLSQYQLQDPIGHGSYGLVQLAYSQRNDTSYAVKILNKKKILQRAGMFARGRVGLSRRGAGDGKCPTVSNPLDQVYREIAVLKKLSHPNVVSLVDVFDDSNDNKLYLVFELLEKGPILEIPTSQPLNEATARRYFRDVVMGIEYLHHQKVIHRDIKPANLLLSNCDRVKIADFGVCNEFTGSDAYLTGTSGSPAFLPPEALQAKQKGAYSGRMADIWSMGVTLYALVSGQLPFHDNNIVALYRKIQTELPHLITSPATSSSSRSTSMSHSGVQASTLLSTPCTVSTSRVVASHTSPVPELSCNLRHLLTALLDKNPQERITLDQVREHDWLTDEGAAPLTSTSANCRHVVDVSEDEVRQCVQSVPSINTVIMLKSMFRNRSFLHPFRSATTDSGDELANGSELDSSVDLHTQSQRGRRNRSCSVPTIIAPDLAALNANYEQRDAPLSPVAEVVDAVFPNEDVGN